MYITIEIAMFICSKWGAEYVEKFEQALAYAMGKNEHYGNEVLLPHLTKMWVNVWAVTLPTSSKHMSRVVEVYVDGYGYDQRDLCAMFAQACPVFEHVK